MKKFKKILFPIDFSQVSVEIVPYVISLADKFNAEVHVIFVVPQLENCRSIFESQVSAECFQREVVLGSGMDEFVAEHFKHIRPKTKILFGDIVAEIIKYIKAQGIDLVIIGTHGRTGVERRALGSVADRVVKLAPVSVLIVHASLSQENITNLTSARA